MLLLPGGHSYVYSQEYWDYLQQVDLSDDTAPEHVVDPVLDDALVEQDPNLVVSKVTDSVLDAIFERDSDLVVEESTTFKPEKISPVWEEKRIEDPKEIDMGIGQVSDEISTVRMSDVFFPKRVFRPGGRSFFRLSEEERRECLPDRLKIRDCLNWYDTADIEFYSQIPGVNVTYRANGPKIRTWLLDDEYEFCYQRFDIFSECLRFLSYRNLPSQRYESSKTTPMSTYTAFDGNDLLEMDVEDYTLLDVSPENVTDDWESGWSDNVGSLYGSLDYLNYLSWLGFGLLGFGKCLPETYFANSIISSSLSFSFLILVSIFCGCFFGRYMSL